MKILRTSTDLPPGPRRVCVAIGVFDGVHLGHQQVIRQTVADAEQHEALSAVEGHDHGECFVLLCIGDGLPDDLLMPKMHAIEDPDGHADAARSGREIGEIGRAHV